MIDDSEACNARRILRDRATALASPEQQVDTSDHLHIIEFTIGSECYAIELAYAAEVRRLSNLTPLPGTPRYIAGVISVRSRIVSVVDLKAVLDLPTVPRTGTESVLILYQDSMEFGLLVDSVTGARELPIAQIHPPLPTLHGSGSHYIRGSTASSLIVLDGGRILSDASLVVNESVES